MQEDKLGLIDLILSAAVTIAAFFLLTVWAFPAPHPRIWSELSVMAGFVPCEQAMPGFAHLVGTSLFALLPFKAALAVSFVLGRIVVALAAGLLFLLLRESMIHFSFLRARNEARRRVLVRFLALIVAFTFLAADPVWRLGMGFTSGGCLLLLTVLALVFFIRFVGSGKVRWAIACVVALGFLTAESPLGVFSLACLWGGGALLVRSGAAQAWGQFLNPLPMQRTKWILTYCYLAAFGLGLGVCLAAFALTHGPEATQMPLARFLIVWVRSYGTAIVSSMTPMGLTALFVTSLLPCCLAGGLLRPATDEERFLHFRYGVLYTLVFGLAFSQLSSFDFLWLWTLLRENIIRSPYLFGVFALLASVAVFFALVVFGVEVWCRDYKHIESVLYPELSDAPEEALGIALARVDVANANRRLARAKAKGKLRHVTLGRAIFVVLVVAVVLLGIPGRRLVADRVLVGLLQDFVDETIREAEGTGYLFTDGGCDPLVNVRCASLGIPLKVVSMMGDDSVIDRLVRGHGVTNAEDRVLLELGAPNALRTWVTAKRERLVEASVQCGFEIFGLDRLMTPVWGGVLARASGWKAEDVDAGVARAKALGDRIVDAHVRGLYEGAKDEFVKDRFLFAQYRLSALARRRARTCDAKRDRAGSVRETTFADSLDMRNPSLKRLIQAWHWMRRQHGDALTPREGLALALKRADFNMGVRYAQPVLKEDPDDPDANFVMGMSAYADGEYMKAEPFLRRCLKRKPKEPAVWNNLAIVLFETARPEEAKRCAARALELSPQTTEILETVKKIDDFLASPEWKYRDFVRKDGRER